MDKKFKFTVINENDWQLENCPLCVCCLKVVPTELKYYDRIVSCLIKLIGKLYEMCFAFKYKQLLLLRNRTMLFPLHC